ncbi:MAG: cyclic pyranopterin monophosphate synthase MoaC [Phycisphaerales bacterium]|jgi:cyclic pyranopterin phosphate synthase
MSKLSHIDASGAASMVDVGDKPVTRRVAVAEAFVDVSGELAAAIRENSLAKGDLLAVARLAGVQAAKRTDELIPLCHSLPLDVVDVQAAVTPADAASHHVRIVATASTHSRTGVEMEALVAAGVAALTVIDMGKAIDRAMVVRGLRVLEKRGGRGGEYVAKDRVP